MYFISTRGGEKVTGAQAIVQGLAKNGGLFVPETFPEFKAEELEEMMQNADGSSREAIRRCMEEIKRT